MTEAHVSQSRIMKFYGEVRNGIVTKYAAEIPFNFRLQRGTESRSTAPEFRQRILDWLNDMPKGEKIHPNWVVSTSSLKGKK